MIRTGICIAALALAACQPTVGSAPASAPVANTPEARWEQKVVAVSVAEKIADACYGQGIVLAPSPYVGAVNRATEELAAEGVARDRLDAIYRAHDFAATQVKIDGYILERGGDPATPETLCPLGANEMTQGTAVGRALTQV